ncbi:MAG: G-D-S-L family lipolytic protein [Bacteroidetes bacterium]|nr:G-D-S-L family lipolytic protein [Bacteroidota bacterium]MBS1972773.1 G-D-S-L family lipolytic protein [Bacteroidota bacterium]
MITRKFFCQVLLLAIGFLNLNAQPFKADIENFKKQDSIVPPMQHAILFVGSSSFTKWTDIQDYFPGYPIINRGFGGSTLPDVIYYAKDIIFPYQPKQVVIYCGDNDFASSDTISARTVVARFKKLFWIIRKKLPATSIVFISVKPSPSRAKLMTKEVVGNRTIRDFLAKQKNTAFVDVYHLMLDESGKPLSSIFMQDSLHMNANGYAIWKKAIEPVLEK